MKLAVVILNYNGQEFLKAFLAGVCHHSSIEAVEVVVADNASTDDSLAFLAANFPRVRVIALPQNYGFSKGYNEALKQIEAQYYVLLNSDVEVSVRWIQPILSLLETHPEVGAAQPKIMAYAQKTHFEYAGASGGYLDALGYPYCRGRLFDTCEPDQGQYDEPTEVFWATGACLFVRASLYHQLGGLDDDFFAHMEEIDFCWRLKNAGHKLWVVPQSVVYHVGGGTLNKINPRKTFLNFRNNLMMLHKNLPASYLFCVIFARLCLDGLAGLQFLAKRQWAHCWAIVKAHWAYYAAWPSLQSKRKAIKLFKKHEAYAETKPISIIWQYFFRKRKHFSDIKF
ncbi:MAG: glycosyltransferase family 2 protein [Cytophagales bacterium]|nr:MAG: glycosyltransferase family 2 protein [Cytophagales bacterium]TAF59311.1 MAG: glycosyltransferase family 2 protein [Cytophagales bacterium]